MKEKLVEKKDVLIDTRDYYIYINVTHVAVHTAKLREIWVWSGDKIVETKMFKNI